VTDVPTVTAGESAWDKLRRRKVVQWGIVYAAGAWGLLQGLEYVTSTFDWPRQVQQFATLGLLIGLPVVLVTAWYHGDQGRQRVSAAELTIITLLFLLGGGIFWRYDTASDAPPPAPAPGATVQATDAKFVAASIAVWPFADLSQAGDQGYFSDGMAEEILNVLAKVKGLQVASRTSSFAFKDQEDLGIPAIARQLGVPLLWGEDNRRYRQSPQFKRLIRESGVYDYWRKAGFPKQCQPVGADDFSCD